LVSEDDKILVLIVFLVFELDLIVLTKSSPASNRCSETSVVTTFKKVVYFCIDFCVFCYEDKKELGGPS